MKTQIESSVARILVRIQIAAANIDPEVLQWPGGSVIASLLCLCAMARSIGGPAPLAQLTTVAQQGSSFLIAA